MPPEGKTSAALLGTARPQFAGPIFVIGMPRSGTKLLRDLLNQHSRLHILDIETEFLPYIVGTWSSYKHINEYSGFLQFYNRITRFPYFIYRRDADRLIRPQDWFACCREMTPAGVFEALARTESGAGWAPTHIWGDKSPSYINDIPLLKSLYPDARIIHLIRDVRDYCLSIHQAWGKNMLRAAQRWTDDVSGAHDSGSRLGDSYLEVRYEDLLTDVAHTMKTICVFLGLQYEEAMCSLSHQSENLGAARGSREILRGNAGKYHRLDGRTLVRIESIAGRTMRQFRYQLLNPEVKTTRLSTLQMLCLQVSDAFNLVAGERRERGWLEAFTFYLRYFVLTRVRNSQA